MTSGGEWRGRVTIGVTGEEEWLLLVPLLLLRSLPYKTMKN